MPSLSRRVFLIILIWGAVFNSLPSRLVAQQTPATPIPEPTESMSAMGGMGGHGDRH